MESIWKLLVYLKSILFLSFIWAEQYLNKIQKLQRCKMVHAHLKSIVYFFSPKYATMDAFKHVFVPCTKIAESWS